MQYFGCSTRSYTYRCAIGNVPIFMRAKQEIVGVKVKVEAKCLHYKPWFGPEGG